MRRTSRLTKNAQKKTKKTIILSIIGIIVILFLLVKFGIGFLVSFSLFISGSKNQTNSQNNLNQVSFLSSPILNPLPTATNSAQIIISGKSVAKSLVSIYINGSNVDETETDTKGNFTFTENLKTGDNQIKVLAKLTDRKSDFSDTITNMYNNSQPKLDIASPSDNQHFTKVDTNIPVSGQTDPGVTVTVNGFYAILDENNNFSYNLPLKNGDNEIKIIATDQAGNKTEKNLKVNYSQ